MVLPLTFGPNLAGLSSKLIRSIRRVW